MLSETLESPLKKPIVSQDDGRSLRLSRKSPRFSVHFRAILYCGTSFQTTLVSDISTDGAGLEGAAGVAPGDDVMIKLLDGREFAGKVVWWLDGKCGVAFDRRLKETDPVFQPRRNRLLTL